MLIRCRALVVAAAALFTFPGIALAADLRLTDVAAQEDSKRVTLRFTFSEPVKPDVTYFYTHNYVGLRASGLQFSSKQLKTEVPAPSADAKRAYRYVRFVQDRESGEIRLYLTKPLTPADAQVVPYDTYTEVTLLKPALTTSSATEEDSEAAEPGSDPLAADPSAEQVVTAPTNGDTPPTLRPNGLPPATEEEPAANEPPPATTEPVKQPAQDTIPEEPQAEPAAPPVQQPQGRIGGPSYTEFDLDKVPVKQLTFKGIPFREAIMELVAGTGYNVVVADDVDNGEVTLNFNQKELSLKSALDLLALGFDLEWSIQPDAIVIKAKPQP